MSHRAAALIVRHGHALLLRRVKNGEEYYVIPGGGIEEGETPEEAAIREVKEEVSLDVKLHKYLFRTEYSGREGHHFLALKFNGEPILGGEELEQMTDADQTYITWMPLLDLPWLE
ncbi:MAG TPA: NUDIX domain-containing protein, partial [Candidatus Paceibacterota bacterium]|nr:NUDIX domain-containing protein [Candidatus Paceibacterota bacterium]